MIEKITIPNIMYSVSHQYLGLFVCSLKSLLMHGGYFHYNVYVLHSSLDEGVIKALRKDFSSGITLHFIYVNNDKRKYLPDDPETFAETFYRFLAPFLLPNKIDRVLYLDADTLVINSIRDFYEMEFEGNAVVGCTHGGKYTDKINRERIRKKKRVLQIDPGILLMDLCYIRNHHLPEDIALMAQKQKTNLREADNFLVSEIYGDQIKLIDSLKYNLSEQVMEIHNTEHKHHQIDETWIQTNSIILHYCGFPKPGTSGYYGKLESFYKELLHERLKGELKNS